MILLAEHDEPTLAAKKKRQPGASSWPTSTPKNRVWGFENTPSGRPAVEPQLSWETATGSVQYTYQIASGRAEWLSRDPIAERGGINLYAYVMNDPLRFIDPLGLCTYGWGLAGNLAGGGYGGSVNFQITFSNSPTGNWSDASLGVTAGFTGGGNSGASAGIGFLDTQSGANTNLDFNGWSGSMGTSANVFGPVVLGYDHGNIPLTGSKTPPSALCNETNNFFFGLGANLTRVGPVAAPFDVQVGVGDTAGANISFGSILSALWSISLGDN